MARRHLLDCGGDHRHAGGILRGLRQVARGILRIAKRFWNEPVKWLANVHLPSGLVTHPPHREIERTATCREGAKKSGGSLRHPSNTKKGERPWKPLCRGVAVSGTGNGRAEPVRRESRTRPRVNRCGGVETAAGSVPHTSPDLRTAALRSQSRPGHTGQLAAARADHGDSGRPPALQEHGSPLASEDQKGWTIMAEARALEDCLEPTQVALGKEP